MAINNGSHNYLLRNPISNHSNRQPDRKEDQTRMHKVVFDSCKRIKNQKPVIRNPLKETHSANNIVHNDVNIADLQKQISDLKKLFVRMSFKIKRQNAITACSLTLQTIVTTAPTYTFQRIKGAKNGETP